MGCDIGQAFCIIYDAMLYLRFLIVGMIVIWGDISSAGILNERDFLISQDYTYSEQNNPSIAVGLGGKFAVIWVDYRSGNGDIYCRLFDSGAVPIADDFIVNDDDSAAWQFEPDLSSDWYGNYFAVWKDYRNSDYPFDPDIYYQKLDSVGFVGINRNITTETPDSSHQSPAVGATGWGKTVLTWADLRNRNWDVFVQSLDIDGSFIGPNRQVNDDSTATAQHEPEIALSPEGWFVVVWYDRRNGDEDVYLQKFDSGGNAVGSNLRVNDILTDTKQKFPSVAIGGNGVIYVVWTDWRNGNYPDNSDIYGQRFDSDLNRLGNNFRINSDASYASQRDPKVAADRMGNACVVWSDSSDADWNAAGQMIEYTGAIRDPNFDVNLDRAGRQLHPDVAVDGYFLYLTWVDNRGGDYDIFGRLLRYNDPSLLTSPVRLEFSKDIHDSDPAPTAVSLTNAGYGELDYRLVANQSWIVLSRESGTTPDSFAVSINSASLDYGIHQGVVALIDVMHNDSTSILPVILNITGAQIDPEPDSLSFRALAEIGPPSNQNIIVNNSGSGSLNWTLTKTDDWITLDRTSGSADDLISVGCDISLLIAGDYGGYIIIDDENALNSPESLKVSLLMETNMAYMAAQPAAISKTITYGEIYNDSVRILNLGNNISYWQASCEAPWISFHTDSGSDNDIIAFDVWHTTMYPGDYADSIKVTDSLAFNDPIFVPLDIIVMINDSVMIPPAQAEMGKSFQAQMYLHAHNEFRAGLLKLNYDTTMLTVDSIILPVAGELSARTVVEENVTLGDFTVEIVIDSENVTISPGQYHLADLYMTANDLVEGETQFQTIAGDSSFYLEYPDGTRYAVPFESGIIEISSPTIADDDKNDALPAVFSLCQNYPNPFNNRTNISYSLPQSGPAHLEIFNILGQRVKVLVDEYLPAGDYRISWDGRDAAGESMASGIYFYKLQIADFSAVRKMVYLK